MRASTRFSKRSTAKALTAGSPTPCGWYTFNNSVRDGFRSQARRHIKSWAQPISHLSSRCPVLLVQQTAERLHRPHPSVAVSYLPNEFDDELSEFSSCIDHMLALEPQLGHPQVAALSPSFSVSNGLMCIWSEISPKAFITAARRCSVVESPESAGCPTMNPEESEYPLRWCYQRQPWAGHRLQPLPGYHCSKKVYRTPYLMVPVATPAFIQSTRASGNESMN